MRLDIINLLKTNSTLNVESTRLDPVIKEDCPLISVQNVVDTLSNKGIYLRYDRDTTISIIVRVAKTKTYDVDLDVLVNTILSTLLVERPPLKRIDCVTGIQIGYDYDAAGDTNIATASIVLTINDELVFEPEIEDTFSQLHISIVSG